MRKLMKGKKERYIGGRGGTEELTAEEGTEEGGRGSGKEASKR